jgi:hypothetical protein
MKKWIKLVVFGGEEEVFETAEENEWGLPCWVTRVHPGLLVYWKRMLKEFGESKMCEDLIGGVGSMMLFWMLIGLVRLWRSW